LKLAPTKANLLHVARKREAILYEIAQGTFNYGKHFPNSANSRARSGRSVQTVGLALDAWLVAKRNQCAASTLRDYESSISFHLKPSFGERMLSDGDQGLDRGPDDFRQAHK
jgi:integrase